MAEIKVDVAFVTKYWESGGILRVTGCHTDEDGYLRRDLGHCTSPSYLFISKKDWFTSIEDAHAAVKARAKKLIPKLKEKIKKLEDVTKYSVEVVNHDPEFE